MKVLARTLSIALLFIVFLSTASAETIKPLVKPINTAGYILNGTTLQNRSDVSVIRTGNIQFDASLLEENVTLGDTYPSKHATSTTSQSTASLFSVEVFKDKVFAIELTEKTQHAGQSVSFQGRTLDSDLLNVVIVMTKKILHHHDR